MLLGILFTCGVLLLGLISTAAFKIVGREFGLFAFSAVFFPGIFILIQIAGRLDGGKLRSLSDFKQAIIEGCEMFGAWAVAMLAASAIALAVFVASWARGL